MRKGFDRKLPSEHEKVRTDAEAKHEAEAEEARRKDARLRAAFDWLLKQENGRIVWSWFFNRCGYNKPLLLRTAGGDVAPLSTEAATAQREVYRDARKMVPPELLIMAEFEAEFGFIIPMKGEKTDAR